MEPSPKHHPPPPHHRLTHFLHTATTFFPPPMLFDSSSSPSSSSPKPPTNTVSPQTSRKPADLNSTGFPVSPLKISGDGKAEGPAFVGQVYSMCDLSGTGLMAVSTHFDIPFISKRTPEWLKKMFAAITRCERSGPVFRFFMDLGDAVSYVRRQNIPTAVVGACRLEVAYEHYKGKPELFQFVPNEKQVKAANELLKEIPNTGGRRKIDGVPVFSAQNLEIAIATMNGVKWYTPYFFDKSMLDKILEDSFDQHFQDLIQLRHKERRREVIDDSLAAEAMEDMGDSLLEPPEIQEMMDDDGPPAIPLGIIAKAAEIQLLHAVDRLLLGNRWFRKTTGIQPRIPYIVDSFERRSSAASLRASESARCLSSSEDSRQKPDLRVHDNSHVKQGGIPDLRLAFADWFDNHWLNRKSMHQDQSREYIVDQGRQQNPLLPKITMIGVSTSERGQLSKTGLKKTMEALTEHLEQEDMRKKIDGNSMESNAHDRDPLFVANVGDYNYGMTRRKVRRNR